MKKNVILALVFILVLTHIIPPNHISFAESSESECEIANFTIQTIVVNDENIKGQGTSGQILDIEFKSNGKKDVIEIDNNGEFEYKIKSDKVAEKDKIIISNDYYKIKIDVAAEGTVAKEIKSKQYIECPVEYEVSEEASEDKESEKFSDVETETEEEVVEEETPVETEIENQTEEAVEKETSVETEIEDQTEEEAVEKDTPVKIEIENQTEEVVEEETSVETEIENQTEEDVEKETSVETEIEDQTEEEAVEEETSVETETENQTEEEGLPDEASEDRGDFKSFSNESRIPTSSILSASTAPINPIVGSTVYVSNYNEFINALDNDRTEEVILTADISTTGLGTVNVDSRTDQKILEANGHSINLGAKIMVLDSNLEDFIVRNASNLLTTNKDPVEGFFRKKGSMVNLHLENISFNALDNDTAGKLGSNWEGEVHFYGTNVINTYNSTNTLAFRKVVVHNFSSLTINHKSDGEALLFNRNLLSYGDNKYGLEVASGAHLTINSHGAVTRADFLLNLLPSRSLTYIFDSDSTVYLSGNDQNIFNNGNSDIDLHINKPNMVNFENSRPGGRLFSTGEEVRFNISGVSLHGWNNQSVNDEPSSLTPIIKDGKFNFGTSMTSIKSMTPTIPNFSSDFPPTIQRLMFSQFETHDMEISVEDINDTSRQIQGRTNSGATVEIHDGTDDTVIATTEADNEGRFVFELDAPLEKGEILKFQSKLDNNQSEVIEKTVFGNRLELVDVPSTIPFESTEIQDKEIVIERENTNMTISVMDTRSNSNWHLTAKALNPLTDSEGNKRLNEALYYIKGNSEELIENETVLVAEKNQSSDNDLQKLSWGPKEGILLKINPIQAQTGTEYSTIIEWTLVNGPF